MSFISYAQNYEDVILWRAFRDVERGFYVDVGAADPVEDSVTNAFYERGWSGINIEPFDEYFRKLTEARPRDININAAVAQEAGLRIMFTFAGTGLSTLDPKIAARHKVAGRQASETVVPVLTLKAILENCAPSTIHFLKIDVEGAEVEVLKGLDLNLVRPWVIVVEGTAPNSQVNTREDWEHLIINYGYGFAYFDGLNCFYVADEIGNLKERLFIPPNFFDDFVCFPEWAIRQEAAKLKQEIAGLRGHAGGLEAALKLEEEQTANVRGALQVEQEHASNLRNALKGEQAQNASLQAQNASLQAQNASLQAQNASLQARLDHLLGRIYQLEAQLAVPSVDRAIGRALTYVHKTGDRLTGGGLRSLLRRVLTASVRRSMRNPGLMTLGRAVSKPFPKVATTLYQLATKQDAVATSSIPSPAEAVLADDAATIAALPASARSIYLRLKAAISDSDTLNRTQ